MSEMQSDPRLLEQDEGLRCLECGYNLTGLVEERCPECGNAFDRRDLLRRTSPEPRAVGSWNPRSIQDVPAAFLKTAVLAAFEPTAFAGDFPRRHHTKSAWAYTGICYATAVLIGATIALLFGATLVLIVVCAILLTGLIMEDLVAAFLSVWVGATHVPRRDTFHFWRGVTHYYGAFIMIPVASPLLGMFLFVPELLSLGAVVWWVGAIVMCVAARAPRDRKGRVALVIIAIPIIGLLVSYIVMLLAIGVADILGCFN